MNWTNVTVKLGDLQPWEHNPRTMTKRQAQRLIKSWQTLGQFQTIAIGPAGEVYDGHQRLSALLAVHGAGYEIEARQCERELSEDERRYLITQANLPVGAWNFETIAGWPEAQEWGFDVEMLKTWNADGAALATMLQADEANGDADAEPQIDRAAELNEKWQVKTGDLWRIGDHRLLCGDSTKREDVERVMQGDVAELLFTSPPYADMREYEGDDVSVETLARFISSWNDSARYMAVNLGMKRDDYQIVQYWNEYIEAAKSCGLKLLAWNVWCKNDAGSIANQTAMFGIIHEWIFIFGALPKSLNRTLENKTAGGRAGLNRRLANGNVERTTGPKVVQDFRQLDSVCFFDVKRGDNGVDHPAQFPIELPTEYILAMTSTGDTVADCFCGGGASIVACENTRRKCRAIEISPNYCAVILERMITAFPDIVIERVEA
jgi:DNA modification methylase